MSFAQRLALFPLQIYRRFLSPLKASPSCRFHPTCSKYAVDALTQHGVLKGSVLTLKRVLKCQPFHPGGFDPVPARVSLTSKSGTKLRHETTLNHTEGTVHAKGDTFEACPHPEEF